MPSVAVGLASGCDSMDNDCSYSLRHPMTLPYNTVNEEPISQPPLLVTFHTQVKQRRNTKHTSETSFSMSKLLTILLLVRNILSIQSQCDPCDITPNGWAVRPGTGCTEYINCVAGEEAIVNTCQGGTIFDKAISK